MDMEVPGYTNKKGVVTPSTTVQAHYTNDPRKRKFIGRVSKLGSEPIPYPMPHTATAHLNPLHQPADPDPTANVVVTPHPTPYIITPSFSPVSKSAVDEFEVDFFPV